MTVTSTSNPIVIDASGGVTGICLVRMIQWVDDDNGVGDGDDLTLVINGVTLVVNVIDASSVSPVIWQIGPFNPAIPMKDITASIANGIVHIWLD